MTGRPLLTRLLFAAVTATLLGCSPSGQDSQAGKTLKVTFFRDNTTLVSLDPFQVYWLEHRVVLRNVAESLTDQEPQTGNIIPWLAERWDVSENALEYTFHLRKDVTFSNGTRFDAQAVKTAYDTNKAFADLYPNTRGNRILADRQVRLALQKAIDRKTYSATVYNPQFPVVSGIYDVTTPFYKNQADKLAYDPQGAERLLDEAGWAKNADGYRYKDGKRLKLVYNLSPAETAGDVLIQDQLRKVGIEFKLNVVTTAEWAANNAAGNYDLTYTYMTRADPIILQTIIDPRSANSSTLATNLYAPQTLPKALDLFDAGLTATRSEQRAKAYGDLQDLLIDEGSAFPVYERVWQAATAKNVRNFHWTAEGFALFNDIEIAAP
ncbi:nickel ABC transporter, periplasmic nickel-binding protein [Pseudomonas syringae pv. actinidiae ICMP 19071]|uniref:ABC transporter substrate-binding protein n=1 Tax=Pseudomonas syringae TaxID=317 RepID=UPI0003573274|nr:ABC transporter substrate-binding protein [Pseudomonas syringae]EPM55505.1 nickel ABC transporter, periplasmic nickel-binding protein [Pseudomonas syringae pv. actinidiae ICMP 19071]EPM75213.1 nickel ABC transporter, periplasmic nickel-binding protein [Pseudomonas syringae pv. actinidiae ICMP 19072]OSN67832.1 Oligopeptide-binding protein AppA [Pseudomonas syringae pv. actinidiae]OSN78186.1 Oligopeptide-binding protein AppA [Pseudomonas syringae pv. actinidiae]RMS02713.1 hypothetical protein